MLNLGAIYHEPDTKGRATGTKGHGTICILRAVCQQMLVFRCEMQEFSEISDSRHVQGKSLW
jgi:hypothetical protein